MEKISTNLISMTVVFIGFILILLYCLVIYQNNGGKMSDDRREILRLEVALAEFQVLVGPIDEILNVKSEKQSNEEIMRILISDKFKGGPYFKIHEKYYKNKLYVDSWGNPFNIYIDIDDDNQIKLNGRVIKNTDVIIWSNGKNGINEYGEGDDIW